MERNIQKRFLFETVLKLAFESSESDSDSDSDLAEVTYNYYEQQIPRISKIHCKNYIDVVWQYTDLDFKSHFR